MIWSRECKIYKFMVKKYCKNEFGSMKADDLKNVEHLF